MTRPTSLVSLFLIFLVGLGAKPCQEGSYGPMFRECDESRHPLRMSRVIAPRSSDRGGGGGGQSQAPAFDFQRTLV